MYAIESSGGPKKSHDPSGAAMKPSRLLATKYTSFRI
jgi:hypothetical protein